MNDIDENTQRIPVEVFIAQLRGSSLGKCPRKFGYKALYPKEVEHVIPGEVDARLLDGHWHEYEVKKRLVERGVTFHSGLKYASEVKIPLWENFSVIGHTDGEVEIPEGAVKAVPSGEYLIEVKSMAPGYYWKFVKAGYRMTFPDYFDQLQGYLNAEEPIHWVAVNSEDNPAGALYTNLEGYEVSDSHWVMPRVGLVIAKNKETGAMWTEVVPQDPGYFAGLQRRWKYAWEDVESGELPSRLHEDKNNYECGRCLWAKECWEEEGGLVVVPPAEVVVTPEVADLARLYAAGDRLSKLGEAMMEHAKPALTLEEVGKTAIGPVTLSAHTRTTTSWNHKELEKMLTPQELGLVRVEKTTVVNRRVVTEFSSQEVREVLEELRGVSEFQPLLLETGESSVG